MAASPLSNRTALDFEGRLEHAKGALGRLLREPGAMVALDVPPPLNGRTSTSSPSSASPGFGSMRRRAALEAPMRPGRWPLPKQSRYAPEVPRELDEEEEEAGLRALLARKEICLECENPAVTEQLARHMETDLRMLVSGLLTKQGVGRRELKNVRRIVLDVQDGGPAETRRNGAALFQALAASLRSRLQGLTEVQLLAATVLLTELSISGATLPPNLKQPRTPFHWESMRQEALEFDRGEGGPQMRAEIVRQTERLLFPEVPEDEMPPPEPPAPPKDMGVGKRMQALMRRWNAEEQRLSGQIARAQEQIKEFLAEKENQTWYMKRTVDRHFVQRESEKCFSRSELLEMPLSAVRVCMYPKPVKVKGQRSKYNVTPPPTDEEREVLARVIAGAGRQFSVKPKDVIVKNLSGAITIADVLVQKHHSVTGVYEAVQAAFADEMDGEGVRAACEKFAGFDDLQVFRRWPLEILRAEVESRFGLSLPTAVLEEVTAAVEACHAKGRQLWNDLVAGIGAEEEDEERQRQLKEAMEDLTDMHSKLPEDPLGIRQGASTLEELLSDAAVAQQRLKQELAPKTRWARSVPDEALALNDERRSWLRFVDESPPPPPEEEEEVAEEDAPPTPTRRPKPAEDVLNGEGLLGGRHWDLGTKSAQAVMDTVNATGNRDVSDSFRDNSSVARITVTFASPKRFNAAVEKLRSALDVVSLRNRLASPTCLGVRDVVLVVRLRLPNTSSGAGDGESYEEGQERVHLMELRLAFAELDNFRKTEVRACIDKIDSAFKAVNGASSAVARQLRRCALEIFELTNGRAADYHSKTHLQLRRPIVRLPHEERDENPGSDEILARHAELRDESQPFSPR
eukprot:TRINITY_DN64878_c0_g1_i1.p1 TRINITY_DN64878_c0_g1~~TRINITY_DN64878_c0_g1_i1.p1  ORF type:complete len:917 (-),score=229.14 TRINITY_DN64878_c0_g1_i1:74-2644(-)